MSDVAAVSQVLARYVRATDRRDGRAMGALFVEDGTVEMFWFNSGNPQPLGQLAGREQIAWAVANMMVPHPALGFSHHTTMDHIVTIDGDDAEVDAQFIVYNTLGANRPETGWPKNAQGARGAVMPIEAGYYRSKMKRVDGEWRIVTHRIDLALPVAGAE